VVLDFSLFDVASVPFAIPQYIQVQCILHRLTIALLCVPFIFVEIESVISVVARDGFSS